AACSPGAQDRAAEAQFARCGRSRGSGFGRPGFGICSSWYSSSSFFVLNSSVLARDRKRVKVFGRPEALALLTGLPFRGSLDQVLNCERLQSAHCPRTGERGIRGPTSTWSSETLCADH